MTSNAATSLIDVTKNNGEQVGGINKPTKNVILDGGLNILNDLVPKYVPNGNYATPFYNFGTSLINKAIKPEDEKK